MTDKKAPRAWSLRHLLLIAMGAMILYLGAGFVQKVGLSLERREDLRLLEEQIVRAEYEEASLEAELEYVKSAAAAEAWARENGWARKDEVAVVVVAPPSTAPLGSSGGVRAGLEPSSFRDQWWDLFFGRQ
ncbi:MAG: hypothetical protein M8467_04790 [Anaerolineae bacterium]|nr:hypothetical protein [Anaerolineae bacterium]